MYKYKVTKQSHTHLTLQKKKSYAVMKNLITPPLYVINENYNSFLVFFVK